MEKKLFVGEGYMKRKQGRAFASAPVPPVTILFIGGWGRGGAGMNCFAFFDIFKCQNGGLKVAKFYF